ncbi:Transmembrane nucleoporin [Vanrija albida]|uniref:Transmembrane nucleoporin n=1 Tax=Vanrija albida TaxID=181172 RepID=A0ABR3PYZ8_9TREE
MASILDPHYLWAFGHATVLVNSAYILLQTLLFRGTPTTPYRLVYLGALLSYSIVVFKSLGRPTGTAWLRRAFVDENAQYGLLAFYWLISKPINVTILPFATFSLFHCATFLRTNILPKFYPKVPAGAQRPPPNWAESLGRKIQLWVKGNYDKAMNFVAYAEILILARVTLGALTFRGSFVAPLFLAHFIRLRYHASPFTRSTINTIGAKIDQLAAGHPGAIQNGWTTVKRAIHAWGGGNLVPQPGPAPAGGPAPAAPRQ